MANAGYSGTPLAKKLGIKPGFTVRLIQQPEYYFHLFSDWPEEVSILQDTKSKKQLIHYFVVQARELQQQLPLLKKELEQNGILWISWYKKAARMPTDITEDFIRQLALNNGMVDVKVCAVDEYWSGLKLVIPVKDRISH
jgi:hypothetical protein